MPSILNIILNLALLSHIQITIIIILHGNYFFYMNLFVKKNQLHSYSLGCGRKVIKDKTAKSNVELPAVVTSCGKEAAESSHNS